MQQHVHAKFAIVAVAAALAAGCSNDTTTDAEDTTGPATATTTAEGTPGEETDTTAPESPDAGEPTTPGETTTIAVPDGEEFVLGGAVLEKYNELGGQTGTLGMPTSDEQEGPNDGRFVTFDGGTIYWSPETGAYAVWGAILEAFEGEGGAGGALGYPTSDERTIAGGWEADFENGTIRYVDGEAQVETR